MEAESRTYGQYCPVSRAVEILGDRWTLLVVRDLVVGATRFNELARGNPGLSRSLLAQRLRQLERAGIVEHVGHDYLLTEAGHALRPVVMALGDWGARWAFDDPTADELDPDLLVWWMHGRLAVDARPGQPWVLSVEFTRPRADYWIVVDSTGASVCRTDPGFDIQLAVEAELSALYAVWLGRRPLAAAIRAGDVVVSGPASRQVSSVLSLSPVASLVSAAP